MYLRETSLAGSGGRESPHHGAVPKVFAAAPSHFHAQTPPRPRGDPGLKDYSEFQWITRARGFPTTTTEIRNNKILPLVGVAQVGLCKGYRTEKHLKMRREIREQQLREELQNQNCSLGEKAENVKVLLK